MPLLQELRRTRSRPTHLAPLELQFVKAFALHARTTAQLDRLSALVDGTRTVPGLDLTTDLRWELLTALVAYDRYRVVCTPLHPLHTHAPHSSRQDGPLGGC